jgi:hypothetical protein
LFLEIKQSSHDVFFLQAILVFLGVGQIKPKSNLYDPSMIQASLSQSVLVVRNSSAILNFLAANPLLTRKALEFECWKELSELREAKIRLTAEGALQVKYLQSQMNSKRV